MADSFTSVTLNGVIYSTEQLPANFAVLNAFEQSVIQFCVDWTKGRNEFTLSTSGSTGQPKKITLTRTQMQASARQTALALGLRAEMTALVCLDARYIAGLMMLVRAMELRMKIIAVDPAANPLRSIPSDVPIDFVALVPYQLQAILTSAESDWFNRIQCAIIGGAALDAATKSQLAAYSCQFFATYGMTETLSHVALQKLNGAQASDYFVALPKVIISKDERSCLVVQADFIENKRVVTNDVVDVISKTEFVWLGRWDNVINTGGIKVFPEEIERQVETAFQGYKLTNRFFVGAQPDHRLGERIVLIIEGASLGDADMIMQQLKSHLSAYQLPKEILTVDRFVQTETGKVNRRETLLKIPYQAPQN